jgi:hypothetical protein
MIFSTNTAASFITSLVRVNNLDAVVYSEIITVERDDVFNPMNGHGCDDSRVVCLRASYRMSADEPVPLAVHFLGFENKEKERFEECDVTSDSHRRINKAILLSVSSSDHPELSRDLRKNV